LEEVEFCVFLGISVLWLLLWNGFLKGNVEKGFGRRRGMKGRWEVSKFEFTGRDGKWVVEKRGRGRTKMVRHFLEL
jgi:hypothetical protein